MQKSKIYTEDKLREAVKECLSISDVCRYFGKSPKGGSYEVVKNRLKFHAIDTSHFLGQNFYSGKRNPIYKNRRTVNEILVANVPNRINHRILKKCLLEIGVAYQCNICELTNWNNLPLTLDIDHIDGDWSNCVESNLRFLCPNCHRQTNTFGGKNKTRETGSKPVVDTTVRWL